ncbi:MAG TPA: ComEC/Rec2 family competence protein [Candidatus Saccharimonadales bacterium]|nr:ComEC/Rec2 family competence protein [Candidatus Saccharimonadales bacterium]
MFAGILRYRVPRAVLTGGSCLALFAGMGLAYARPWNHAWLLCACAAVPLWWVLRRHGLVALVFVALCFFGVGWQRGSSVSRQLAHYKPLAFHKVTLLGTAAEDSATGTHHQLAFALSNIYGAESVRQPLPGAVSVAGFGPPLVRRGDTVRVSGKLYPGFGGSQGSMSFATVQVFAHHPSYIDDGRRRFAAGLQSALPEPLASFGMGLLIGQRNTLPTDTAHMLLVGLTHIIAVSGYNLTVIVDVVRRLFAGRSKFQTAAGCVSLILLFVTLTGSSPSIVRAAIISVLSILAWYYGRTIPPFVLLLAAGCISVLANPLYLWGNISWYLSFLAFFGVVVVAPLVTKRLCGAREPPALLALIIESLCAEAMTLPYVLHTFGQMSLVGLPANVLVVAFVPLAMLLCMVAGLAGMLLPAAAGWLAWPAKWLLTYMLDAANVLSRTPHSFIQGIGFPLPFMLAAYALIIWFAMLTGLKLHTKYAIITEKKQLERQKGESA